MRKRLKTSSEVFHFFANQTQEEGYVTNASFHNRYKTYRAFSYSQCIGMFTENGSVILSNTNYSVTTSKHENELYAATSHLDQIFVPGWADDSHGEHQRLWQYQADTLVAKLARARKPEIYTDKINSLNKEVTAYHDYFKIQIPELLALVLNASLENLKDISKERYDILERNRLEQKKRDMWIGAISVQNFYDFKSNSVYTGDISDCLRYNEETNRFETGQRVEMPYEIGVRLFESIKNKSIKAGDKILQFSVKKVTENRIEIGCHNFTFEYLEYIASLYIKNEHSRIN